MKKTIYYSFNVRSIFVVLVVAFFVMMLFTVKAKAQKDLVSEMALRLEQQNVPLVSVEVSKRIPFQIEITMQTLNDGTSLNSDDTWNKHLAFREAALSHNYGLAIDSFTLVIVNTKGDVLDWERNFLYPDSPSRQLFLSNSEKLDRKAAQKVISEQFDFYGLQVNKLTVLVGAGSRNDVQTLEIELSTLDISTANEAIPGFMGSLQLQLNEINKETEVAQISICRVWIRDSKGNLLLRYLCDLEVGRHVWGIADGISEDWFPHPDFESDIEKTSSISTVPPYPSPLDPKILLSTPTPIQDPYP